jgi:hypothetical protein
VSKGRRFLIGLGICAGFFLLVAILFPMFAQAKHGNGRSRVIDGVILDGAGRPVANLDIQIVGIGAKPLGTVRTDNDGRFHVDPQLDAKRIIGYQRRGNAKRDVNNKFVVPYRSEDCFEYKLPDKKLGLAEIKRLRFGFLVDSRDSPLPRQWITVADAKLPPQHVQTNNQAIFKFPAAMKDPSPTDASVIGYVITDKTYAVYRGADLVVGSKP